MDFIKQYGQASKEDINRLVLDILPPVLDEVQKKNKLRNLIYSMHKVDKSIENKGNTRNPEWVLSLSK